MQALALWAMLLTTETEIERARNKVVVIRERPVAQVRLAAPFRETTIIRTGGLFNRTTITQIR